MATNQLTEYEQDHLDREIAIVGNQLSLTEEYKARLGNAKKIARLGLVEKHDDHWTVQSQRSDRAYVVYTGEGKGCTCEASVKGGETYCKHYVAVKIQERLNERNRKMERPAPKQQAQAKSTFNGDLVKQAEEESARECQEAYNLTDPKYHRFITLIRQNKRVGGSRQNPIFATIHKPYMRVDGRIQEAIDEATMAGRTIKVETDFDTVGEKKIVIKTVHTERGTASSIACINFGGKGVDETSPLENADTSAYGRALGQLGYGIIGGVASAEEVEQAIEQQAQEPREPDNYAKEGMKAIGNIMLDSIEKNKQGKNDDDDDEREALINEIREYIRPMTQELRVSFFNQFFGCKPAEISEMKTDAIRENWRKACEKLVKE